MPRNVAVHRVQVGRERVRLDHDAVATRGRPIERSQHQVQIDRQAVHQPGLGGVEIGKSGHRRPRTSGVPTPWPRPTRVCLDTGRRPILDDLPDPLRHPHRLAPQRIAHQKRDAADLPASWVGPDRNAELVTPADQWILPFEELRPRLRHHHGATLNGSRCRTQPIRRIRQRPGRGAAYTATAGPSDRPTRHAGGRKREQPASAEDSRGGGRRSDEHIGRSPRGAPAPTTTAAARPGDRHAVAQRYLLARLLDCLHHCLPPETPALFEAEAGVNASSSSSMYRVSRPARLGVVNTSR